MRLKHFVSMFFMLFALSVGQVWAAVTPLALPKAWDANDGKSAYTNALGCTLTSISSDYSSAPKLKFNATGSTLLIQVADAPAQISFNFKQNGTNAGTFKVQESADGTAFTDALTVTWPGNSKTNTPSTSLKSSTRYIKLIYETKGESTNAAVGGISITKASGGSPTLSLNPTSKEFEATGNSAQTIALTASNFSNSVNSVTWAFYGEAACTNEIDKPTWVNTPTVNNTKTQVSVNVANNNTSSARQTWMKIIVSDGSSEASEVFAISQKKVSVDYATLPFSFNGAREDIGDTDGMTQTGLGTNYSSAPKLKFDGTGDNIVIKLNEDPGILTYDIKGNSYNGSTFKVQESVDGSSYTDVATYTELTSTVQHEEKTLTKTTRYVKFIYTEKVTNGGNVALGNIAIAAYVEPSAVETPSITGETPFLNTTNVTISIPDGSTVYYTTDGSTPTDASTQYSAPFALNNTATVTAIAKNGSDYSAPASQTFTKATVLTVAQARAAIDAGGDLSNKYVAGTISQIDGYNSTYHSITYWISADGTTTSDQLQVYSGLAGVVKTAFAAETDLAVGDDVTVKGTLKKYQTTYEFDKNNTIEAYKPIARLAWSVASFEADLSSSTNTYPTLTNTNNVTVTYGSSDGSAATIDPATGEITLVAEGSTTITASFAGNGTYKANEVSYTLTVANSVIRADISFEENGGSTVADLTQQTNLPNPLPTITKVGKNFGGWYTTSTFDNGTEAVAGAEVESADAITLYAKWLEPYTVAEAMTIITALEDNASTDAQVYVAGIISQVDSYSGTYKSITYWISADGTTSSQLEVYSGLIGNATTALAKEEFSAKTDLEVGDEVVVYGYLKKYVKNNNTTPEFDKNNTIYSFSRKEEAGLEWGVASFDAYIGESNTFPTLTNDHNVAVTYSSTETDYATISNEAGHEGEITLVAEGETVIKATFAGDATYKAAEVSYTLHVHPVVVHASIIYVENDANEDIANVDDAIALPNPLPTVTKDNFIFGGWWTTPTFEDGSEAVAGAAVTSTEPITLYAKWTALPEMAYTYTSNVTLTGAKVKFYGEETEYDAVKAGTGSSAGSTTVTVPAQATKLHFHAYGWNTETVGLTVTAPAGVTVSPATEISINSNSGIANGTPFTLAEGSTPMTDAYYVVELSGNDDEIELTFTATSGKRFVLFGVNHEDGQLPVLESIEIKGDLTNKTGYKAGDDLDLDGLTVEATYSLGGVNQTPVDITDRLGNGLTLTYDPLVENQTEVTITATYGDKSDDITITELEAVASADPLISVSAQNVNFASVEVGGNVPDAQTVTVTLTNVASVTATLGGTNADAFSVSPASLTESGDITISILANTDAAASYAATLTISDGPEGAEDKTVNLSFAVTAPVVEDDVTGTWTLVTNATTLAAGMKVIIAQYVDADGNIQTMAAQSANGNNRTAITSTVATTLTPAVGTKVMTLADAGEGHFYLMTSDGEYLYNASTDKKSYLRTKEDSEDASWTIEVDAEGVATITSVENTNRTQMRYNPNTSGSPLFNCYASGQEDIALYMLEEDTPEPPTPSTPDYVRDVTSGQMGTICLPNAVAAGDYTGATMYSIAYKTSNPVSVELVEENEGLVAGRPYIFIADANANKIEINYTGDAVNEAGHNNGLYGCLESMVINYTVNIGDYAKDAYMLSGGKIKRCGTNCTLQANRAYIVMDNVPEQGGNTQQIPGRRYISLMVEDMQTPTALDEVTATEENAKFILNGQLYILRDGKLYNAQGQLVK